MVHLLENEYLTCTDMVNFHRLANIAKLHQLVTKPYERHCDPLYMIIKLILFCIAKYNVIYTLLFIICPVSVCMYVIRYCIRSCDHMSCGCIMLVRN